MSQTQSTPPNRRPSSRPNTPWSPSSCPSIISSTWELNEIRRPSDGRTPSPASSVPRPSSLRLDGSPRQKRLFEAAMRRRRYRRSVLQWTVILFCLVLATLLWSHRSDSVDLSLWLPSFSNIETSSTTAPPGVPQVDKNTKVERWLQVNGNDRHAFEWQEAQRPLWRQLLSIPNLLRALGVSRNHSPRPRAAIISLVRNEELDGIVQSMKQLELRWNWKYRYQWIFFSEAQFSDEFKAVTSNLTTIAPTYALIPRAHWSTPSHVSQSDLVDSLSYLGTLGVGKGHLPSYRHMCRWNSMFFYHHPALQSFDYYWRVEPDVHFLCDITYDPFRLLRDNDLVYGFNMLIMDDARSFPSLWSMTQDFVSTHEHLIPEANLDDIASWLIDSRTMTYNTCQFFSNFEIGSLDFFRSAGPEAYVRHLDDRSGFFIERFGDAPVHTLSLALFAGRSKIHFFRDIGYQHDIARHCPGPQVNEKCHCEQTRLDENFYRLVPMESPQWKPEDTCVRMFLGKEGGWLEKKSGWEAEAERAFGGDGYGGYARAV